MSWLLGEKRVQTVKRHHSAHWRPRLGAVFALHSLHLLFLTKERGHLCGGVKTSWDKLQFWEISFYCTLDCHMLVEERRFSLDRKHAGCPTLLWLKQPSAGMREERPRSQNCLPRSKDFLSGALVCKTLWQETETGWASMTIEIETSHKHQKKLISKLAKALFATTLSR